MHIVVKRSAGRLSHNGKKNSLTSFPIKSLEVLYLSKDDILRFHNFVAFLIKTKNGCNVKALMITNSKANTNNTNKKKKNTQAK